MISVKPYRKKNGDLMIYVNHYKKGVSVGIGERVFTSELTKGQKNTLADFFETLKKTIPIIDDFQKIEEHTEQMAKLDFDLEVFITDIATVCGNKTGSDGVYLLYKNKLYDLEDIGDPDSQIA